MMSANLFFKSYASLDEQDAEVLHRYFQQDQALTQESSLKTSLENKRFLNDSLAYHGEILAHVNPASFDFLTGEQNKALQTKLFHIFYLFDSQARHHVARREKEALEPLYNQLAQCANLIERLRLKQQGTSPDTILQEQLAYSSQYLKYAGMNFVPPWVLEKISAFPSGESTTAQLKGGIGAINSVRLYWVWAGSLLAAILEMLGFFPEIDKLRTPSPVTSNMSWFLYYVRFSINLFLVLKHTIAGLWMSDEEKNLGWYFRLKHQLNELKYSLINDFFWGIANMLCCFWLRGSGSLGHAGDLLTLTLLLLDLSVCIWQFYEDYVEYHKNMAHWNFTATKDKLQQQIDALNNTPEKIAEQQQLKKELQEVIRMEASMKTAWQTKVYGLICNVAYALGLLIAFAVMCCIPGAGALTSLIGAASCFLFTAAYTTISELFEIRKSKTSYAETIALIAALREEAKISDINVQKQLYLQIKHLEADSVYQQKLVTYQTIKLVRSVLIDLMFPAVALTATLMSLGIGLGILALAFAIIHYSNALIDKHFQPQIAQWTNFYKTSLLPDISQEKYTDAYILVENGNQSELFYVKVGSTLHILTQLPLTSKDYKNSYLVINESFYYVDNQGRCQALAVSSNDTPLLLQKIMGEETMKCLNESELDTLFGPQAIKNNIKVPVEITNSDGFQHALTSMLEKSTTHRNLAKEDVATLITQHTGHSPEKYQGMPDFDEDDFAQFQATLRPEVASLANNSNQRMGFFNKASQAGGLPCHVILPYQNQTAVVAC